MSQSVYSSRTASSKESREGSDRSSRTGHGDISSSGGTPSKGRLRKAEMEFDRRQIRLKLAEKLETMGQNEDAEVLLNEVFEDEVFDQDPGEEFPWKQREAVVAAAASGGVSEDRREGLDSMELALKAQTSTTTTTASTIANARTFYQQSSTKTRSARALADWGLYNQASQHSITSSTVSSSNHYRNVNQGRATPSISSNRSTSSSSFKKSLAGADIYEFETTTQRAQVLEQQQQLLQQQDTSTPLLFRCVYLLVAIGAVIGFIYFTVYFKIG